MRSKKRIHELEQKQETAKLSIINKNNEIKALNMAKHERSGSNLDNIPDTPLSPDVALSGSKSHIATPGKEHETQIQALKDEIRETEQKVKGFRQ